MPADNFFIHSNLIIENRLVKTGIQLHVDHPVFSGHFPGNPVLPGVCMIQIVKEVAENFLNSKLRLAKASELKFLCPVIPKAGKELHLELKIVSDADTHHVEAKLLDEAATQFKFKGIFIVK